jgi:uncharacterized protein
MHSFVPAAAWPRILPFAVFIAILALRGAFPQPTEGAAADGWVLGEALYALQAGLAATVMLAVWRQYSDLAAPPREARDWMLTLLVGAGVFALWITLDQPWMRLGEPATTFVPVAADGTLRWDKIAVRLAGAALVVPLIEELFWRSFVMRALDARDFLARPPAATSALALIGSSVVFALGHDLWLAGLVAGLAYGWLYMRTGNLWYPIAAHAITNAALGVYVIALRQWSLW